jgi:hypothetical protein
MSFHFDAEKADGPKPGQRTAYKRPEGKAGKSRTKQQFRKDCDITEIMSRWSRTGFTGPPPHMATSRALFGDFTSPLHLADTMEQLDILRDHFETLPVAIRDHVDNDPTVLMQMLMDPEATEELVELGYKEDPKDPSGPSGPDDPQPAPTGAVPGDPGTGSPSPPDAEGGEE